MRAADNPFAVHRVLRERYRMSEPGWTRLMERFERLGRRGAIVGRHGCGKTTLLEDLGVRLETLGWRVQHENVKDGVGVLPPNARTILLLDGAEQLSWLGWRALRLRAAGSGGLVITTHTEGRLPTLHRCATSPALLRQLTASLAAPITLEESGCLHARHDGNVRDALRELYDRAARYS